MFNGRPLAVSEARAREDRGPGGPPRPGGFSGPPRPAASHHGRQAPSAVRHGRSTRRRRPPARSRNFGPDAKPQRGGNAKAKKKENERPRGPIPLKATGRSFTSTTTRRTRPLPDIDDFATSKPQEDKPQEDEPGDE